MPVRRGPTIIASDVGSTVAANQAGAVSLFWLPLGAGGPAVVRLSGRVFEVLSARFARRKALDLYHSALVVTLPEGSFAIEMTPVVDERGWKRGVVAEGAVGMRMAGRFRRFRYEVRRWPGGVIPDVSEAVESPLLLTSDLGIARDLYGLVEGIPTPVWGRDELHTGEMWNSNSLISWLIVRSGLPVQSISFPAAGRAPGWNAGILTAARHTFEGRAREGTAGNASAAR